MRSEEEQNEIAEAARKYAESLYQYPLDISRVVEGFIAGEKYN